MGCETRHLVRLELIKAQTYLRLRTVRTCKLSQPKKKTTCVVPTSLKNKLIMVSWLLAFEGLSFRNNRQFSDERRFNSN